MFKLNLEGKHGVQRRRWAQCVSSGAQDHGYFQAQILELFTRSMRLSQHFCYSLDEGGRPTRRKRMVRNYCRTVFSGRSHGLRHLKSFS